MSSNIAIIGGGISGLSTAHYLLRNSLLEGVKISNVYLLEEKNSFGGWLQTKRFGASNHFELGPRTISLNSYAGNNALALASDIGLTDRIRYVPKSSQAFQRRYVAINGSLKLISLGLKQLLTSNKPFKPLLSYIVKDLMTKPIKFNETRKDITVDEFFRFRFGSEIADYMANALCHGISGGDSRQLSMKAMFPGLIQKEQTYGSVIKGMFKEKTDLFKDHINNPLIKRSIDEKWAVFSFQNGIQTFPEQLVNHLDHNYPSIVNLLSSTKVVSIDSIGSNKSIIEISKNGEKKTLEVDHIFSTILSSHLAKILPAECDRLKSALCTIPSIHMAVVCFEFDRLLLPPDYGFGFLVPAIENSDILGVTFDSCIFPTDSNNSKTVVTVMLGGHRFVDLFGSPDKVNTDHLLNIARRALARYVQIEAEPSVSHVAIHQDCIPQYTLGHRERVSSIEEMIRGCNISLSGTSYNGFSVPDSILNAKIEVDKWLQTAKTKQ